MSQSPIWRRYLRLLGPDVGADVDDELQFHLEMRADELVKQGWPQEAARQEAARLFGDVRGIAAECRRLGKLRQRARRRSTLLGEVRRDLNFAVRTALGRPLLSGIIVASLALGIGVNIAIFTVVKGVLLDRLPVDRVDELVLFKWVADGWPGGLTLHGSVRDTEAGGVSSSSFSNSAYRRFADHPGVFSSVFAFAPISRINVNLHGEAVLAEGEVVSGNYFPGLGLKPQVGRLIGPGDDRAESQPVVVLSHAFWRNRCGSDPFVVGQQINLNGNAFTVAGVAPRGFNGTLQVGSSPAIYIPLSHVQKLKRRENVLENVDFWFLRVMGRLEPDADLDLAQATLAPLLRRTVKADLGAETGSDGASDRPLPELDLLPGAQALDERRAGMIGPLTVALGFTVLILLIACANAATLLLAGAVSRRREMAVRLSLGAGRMRIARQLLTESLLLAVAGGVIGFFLSLWVSRGLVLLLESDIESPLVLDLRPDLGVFAFAVIASILTGVVFGLVPALRMPNVELGQTLKEGGDRVGHTMSRSRVGRMLVAGQVALSLILLVGAGLFVRTVNRLASVDPGFNADRVLMFRLDPTLNNYTGDDLVRVCDEITSALEALPGGVSAALAGFSPVSGSGAWDRLTVGPDKKMGSFVGAVDPGFLDTLQIDLLEGRNLSPDDRADSPLVAVVNETFARKAFDDASPVGREFSTGAGDDRLIYRIVGMFRDGNSISLHEEPGAIAYMPHRQVPGLIGLGPVTFFLRTAGHPNVLLGPVREAVSAIDRDLPLFEVRTLAEQIEEAMAMERQFLRLAVFGAVLAVVLSCIGLYGTVSFNFSRRIREIGIRLTLGAERRDILLSAFRELDVVVIGVVLGLSGVWLATRWLDELLFELTATDPLTLATATVLMIGVSALAVFLPARRATLVDPMEVLRLE